MPSCNCFGSSTSCSCLIESGTGVDVNGAGTVDNPYVISQSQTASSQFDVTGPVDGIYTITHTSGSGLITVRELNVASESATNITTNLVDNGDNSLSYTNEPGAVQTFQVLENERNVTRFTNSSAITAGPAVLDDVYHEVQTIVSNNDPHGRTQQVVVNYFWLGFAAFIDNGGTLVIQPAFISNGATWVSLSQWQDYGTVATRQYSGGGWSFSETFNLAPGATRNVGCRYRIGGATNATLSASSFFTNGFTVDREAI